MSDFTIYTTTKNVQLINIKSNKSNKTEVHTDRSHDADVNVLIKRESAKLLCSISNIYSTRCIFLLCYI